MAPFGISATAWEQPRLAALQAVRFLPPVVRCLYKSDPADAAKGGWEALMDGKASVVSGWKNKL